MIHDDEKLRAAAERCAELESWLRLEPDPAERDRIALALKDAHVQLAKEMQRVAKDQGMEASQMFPDGNVTDFLKAMDERAAAAKDAAEVRQVEQAASIAAEPHPAAVEAEAQELVRELVRELEVPAEIRALPDWPPTYQAVATDCDNAIAAGFERAAAAGAEYDQVPELEAGQEIEGEILAIIERDGQGFYVIEGEDGHKALAGVEEEGPEYEPGEEITASRDEEGRYEVSRTYGYGL